MDNEFWNVLDWLVSDKHIVIDRARGSAHPRYPDLIYPLDYGYLDGTRALDGGGIDLWRGSLEEPRVTGVIVTADRLKGDVEIKLLLGCTPAEQHSALAVHNRQSQAGLLVTRRPPPGDIPVSPPCTA